MATTLELHVFVSSLFSTHAHYMYTHAHIGPNIFLKTHNNKFNLSM